MLRTEKKVILLIEDNDKFRDALKALLEDDFQVIPCRDATKGIEVLNTVHPNIILLDIMLPGTVDGFSFLKILKSDEGLLHIPVILISALSSDEIIIEGLRLGANDFVIKPFNFQQLFLKVRNQLDISSKLSLKSVIDLNFSGELKSKEKEMLKEFEMMLEYMIMSDKEVSIKELANRLGISQSTFERLVKKNYGTPPNKYILRRRLEKADILIRSKKSISVKEIAFSLGFSSLSYFSKCYHEHFGRTPSSLAKER